MNFIIIILVILILLKFNKKNIPQRRRIEKYGEVKEYLKEKPIYDDQDEEDSHVFIKGRETRAKENLKLNQGIIFDSTKNKIILGDNIDIGYNCILNPDKNNDLIIGDNVTIKENVILRGCKIGDNCIIGAQSIIQDGVTIGENCVIMPQSLIVNDKEIPKNSLVAGSPAKILRENIDYNKLIKDMNTR